MKRVIAAAAVMCLVIAVPGPALADQGVFRPSAHPYGQSYEHWYAEHMTWLQEIPASENPFFDPSSPLNCESFGKVVFLGPSGADCTIPEGQSVAFSPFFWECSTAEGLGETFLELRKCARQNFANDFGPAVFRFTVRIDGKRLVNPRRWTFETPGEVVVFPDDNIWFAPGGPTKSVTKGFFYILQPMIPGQHEIRVHGDHQVFGEANFVWTLLIED
jgi:hypothetical protein